MFERNNKFIFDDSEEKNLRLLDILPVINHQKGSNNESEEYNHFPTKEGEE